MYWRQFEKCCSPSDELKDLLQGMMQLNPHARDSLEEVMAHPWVQGDTASQEEIRAELSMRKSLCSDNRSTSTSIHN